MQQVHYTKIIFSGPEALSCEEIEQKFFSKFSTHAWFILEQPTRCIADKLSLLPPDWSKHCLSCVVFDAQAEIRIEPEEGNRFACRELRDMAPNDADARRAWVRTTQYLLRHHKVTAPMTRDTRSRLVYCEYFTLDEDGMPILEDARLCQVI